MPVVRRVLRRRDDGASRRAASGTEHAFRRAAALAARIRAAVLGEGAAAQAALLVLAVLCVFQNEVTLRAARAAQRRVRRLAERLQRGDVDGAAADAVVLEGWRWRVLLWVM